MRRSLFSSLPILFLLACNGNADNTAVSSEGLVDSPLVAMDTLHSDTMRATVKVTDESIIGTSEKNPATNEVSKEVKASKADGTSPVIRPDVPGSGVREHGAPSRSALDSLKEAKTKGKK